MHFGVLKHFKNWYAVPLHSDRHFAVAYCQPTTPESTSEVSYTPSLECAFSHAGLVAWNSVPEHIRAEPDIGVLGNCFEDTFFKPSF